MSIGSRDRPWVQIGISAADAIFSGFAQWKIGRREEEESKDTYGGRATDNGQLEGGRLLWLTICPIDALIDAIW